jgi:hypothetical protein
MTEDNYVGVGKTAPHPRCPTARCSAVMDHPDLQAAHLDHSADGQHPGQGNVIVAQYGVDRRNLAQQVKDPRIQNVTCMQDDVCPAKALPRRFRQLPANASVSPPGPQVSISEDYDAKGI